jgi:hypothetical protein
MYQLSHPGMELFGAAAAALEALCMGKAVY